MQLEHEKRGELEKKLAAMTAEQEAATEQVIESNRAAREREIYADLISKNVPQLDASFQANSLSKAEAEKAREIVKDKRLQEAQNVLNAMFPAAATERAQFVPNVKLGERKQSELETKSENAMKIGGAIVEKILRGKSWEANGIVETILPKLKTEKPADETKAEAQ